MCGPQVVIMTVDEMSERKRGGEMMRVMREDLVLTNMISVLHCSYYIIRKFIGLRKSIVGAKSDNPNHLK